MTIQIHPIPILKDNYVWTLIHPESHAAVIIDPGESQPVAHYLKQHQLELKAILITHHHWDHTDGALALRDLYHVPVFAPAQEEVSSKTVDVHDGDMIHVPHFPLSFQVIAIPGHTLGHVAYYVDDMLFCGDTLFACGCGRIFEGTAAQMYHSLQTIAALPNNTKIYCTHEYTLNNLRFAETVEPDNTDIKQRLIDVKTLRDKNIPSLPSLLKDEKATNPFLRCDNQNVKNAIETHAHSKLTDPIQVFTALRLWKDRF